ncbi:hypothetical protein OSB04_014385 [Centaurea solstitialis]|uniref:Uncharacterized protein n=1 Tax=Centaurea solstitialis TaxID=347529 RepID=A0AA38WFJ2_9ASTR|nr:hypothetical protein OSB04_014385 [Centaurea solstitialis]
MDIFSTENSTFSHPSPTSPRISFSHNLDNSLIETEPSSLSNPNPNSDSDFCFTSDLIVQTEASSADELFSNGLILPNYDDIFHQQKPINDASVVESLMIATSQTPPTDAIITDQWEKMETSKEIVSCDHGNGNLSKSFWRIKRSSSLHFESTKLKTNSSFWSLLPLLSRSNSTGSPVAKDRVQNKETHQLMKQSKSSEMAVYGSCSMKPPLKRNHGGAYDYGTRISPVLNVSVPPFVTKSAANLLGLGSFFGHGSTHDQKNKKP